MNQTLVKLGQFALVALITFALFNLQLEYVESYLYDLRVRFTPDRSTSGHISIVSIEQSFVDKYKQEPTVAQHTQMLRRLIEGKPRFIIYVEDPSQLKGTEAEKKAFADLSLEFKNFYVAVLQLPLRGQEEAIRLAPPFEKVQTFPGPYTKDSIAFAADNVSRRVLHSYEGKLMLQPFVASDFNPDIREAKNLRGRFSFVGSEQIYINYVSAGIYPRTDFEAIYEDTWNPNSVKDKIVLVGSDLLLDASKNLYTPLSREPAQRLPLHELHANMIDTFLLNNGPVRVQGVANFIIPLIFSLLCAHVVLTMSPQVGLLVLGSLVVTLLGFGYFSFWLFGIWVELSHTLLSVFVLYYLFIPYRLIMENRRSWEYIQKNKLLTQVEELKSNFISMMSHDLKTPLARIRGMADVIKNDKTQPLSKEQLDAINTIQNSSDDLTGLINSILNFGRIESESIKLHLRSKDINIIVEEAVKKKQYFAKQKRIELITELEPLFSVKMDIELIRQVLANLIENAIKYSPEDTKILISTEETEEGRVTIQVADQGMGIPKDELENIFLKFFRSKDANTSQIKGSGLGLYLAKYFVELHDGQISVDSDVGKGTTFTVTLPT